MIVADFRKPFNDIPEVEWDIQQLLCLGRMYELMVEFLFRKLFASNNHAKEIDSNEAFHEGTSLDSKNPRHKPQDCRVHRGS